MVTAWGVVTLRLEEYLRDGPGGRLFWRVAGTLVTLMVIGSSLVLLALPWQHPDAQPGAPAWWTWAIGIPAELGMVWLGALLAAGIRPACLHVGTAS